MADLKHDNECIGCDYYESDANDYYYEWCHHPDIDDEEGSKLKYQTENGGDLSFFVSTCPLTGKSPYETEGELREPNEEPG